MCTQEMAFVEQSSGNFGLASNLRSLVTRANRRQSLSLSGTNLHREAAGWQTAGPTGNAMWQSTA